MKKTLLLVGMLVSVGSFAQQNSYRLDSDYDKVSKSSTVGIDIPTTATEQGRKFNVERSGLMGKARADVYNYVNIGTSFYDLQTNASVGRRLMLNDDGTIMTAWTFSPDATVDWPNRGSAVNMYDGTSWGAAPTARVETSRTGWPSIGKLRDGSVYTFGHISTDGGFVMSTKAPGDVWKSATPQLQYSGGVPIWNRSANTGDTIHLICNFWSNGGTVPDITIKGVENPTTYSRSFDGGKTWVDRHIFLPGYDSSYYVEGGGDNYAIDARDSIVAVIVGGTGKDLALWKSMDYGNTWTKTVAMEFPVRAYRFGKAILPQDSNYVTSDGAMDVVIDNDGICHIVTGQLGIYDEDTTDESIFLPNYFGVYHWSEVNNTFRVCGTPIDMDEAVDPSTGARWTIASETTASLGSDGQPPSGLSYAARYGRTSISTHPSISVDASNNLFITYDAPLELIFHDYGANLRDIHIVYSSDDGATWSDPQNATQWRDMEVVFGSQSRMADDYVHFVFQVDPIPGTHLQNNGNTGLHPNDESGIYYAAIPTADIMAGLLGANSLNAPTISKDAKVFVVGECFPNPTDGLTNVTLYLRSGSDVSYTITDVLGKVVKRDSYGYLGGGNHQVQMDATSLKSGMYFYTIKTRDHEVTKRMKVVH